VNERRKRQLAFGIAVVLVGIVFALIWASTHRPPESSPQQAILKRLQTAQNACSSGDITKCLELLSDDYQDSAGFSKRLLAIRLNKLRKERWRWSVDLGTPMIIPGTEEGTWEVDVPVQLVQLEPRGGNDIIWHGTVRIIWQKEGKTWRIISSGGWQQDLVIR